MRVVASIHSPEAQQLLNAPIFSVDVETDASQNLDWKPSHKRGLSYVADTTEIGWYSGEDWVLILSAKPKPVPYITEHLERQANGTLESVQTSYDAVKWCFTEEEEAFIKAMLTAENKTVIAHNLIFDMRQLSKFAPIPVESCTYWDTRSIYGLRDKWRYDGTEAGSDESDEGGEGFGSEDGAADLLSLYELYVEKLPPGYADFIAFMKAQRKNFPSIDFKKVPQAVVDYINATSDLQGQADALNAYQVLLTEKGVINSAKQKKALQDQADAIDMSGLVADMMGHYVTFDIVSPYLIYERQITPPKDYKAYPKLLAEDLEYQKFCIDVAARGMRVDREFAITKLKQLHEAYQVELEAMGLGKDPDDWERVGKRDFAVQYLFWGGRFDVLGHQSKTYAKTVKEAIAVAEAAGEQPVNPYPDNETLAAYQFTLLTKNGQAKFSKGFPIKAADFSFGAKAMKDWLKVYPDMNELKNLGRLSKLDGAIIFLEMILRESALDGRAHTLLGRFADTGRNTSSSPNLQNIHFDNSDPVTDMAGILVADDPSSVLIELDYSNAENYSAAMISADNNMAYSCCSTDFHTTRAGFFFGKDVMAGLTPEERKKKRSQAKTVGFGEGYGMGAKKLAITLGMTVEEAQGLLDLSAKAFPDLAAAKETARNFADNNGWIPTWTGRRMRIPTQWWEGRKRFSSYTSGWNYPNQGGVSEIVVRAINRIRRWLLDNNYKTTILSQVHDSLLINLAVDEYPFVPQKIVQIMGSILDEEVRYKATDDHPAITWNNSTSPAIRWLVDLDNIGNSHKWGYEANREYPLPIDEYVNKWGVHKLTEAEMKEGKAPTWINSFGYGEDALKKELAGELGVELDLAEPNAKKEPFQWARLQHAINQLVPLITPMQLNGHVLDFPAAMMVLKTKWERGESDEFVVIQEHLHKLQQVVEEYKQWIS